jgi:hypothetical protein
MQSKLLVKYAEIIFKKAKWQQKYKLEAKEKRSSKRKNISLRLVLAFSSNLLLGCRATLA